MASLYLKSVLLLFSSFVELFSDPEELILDPFAGRTRALVAFAMGRSYVGYEISSDVVKYMRERFDKLSLLKKRKILMC
jgi:DNA modification methylase